LIFAKKWQRFEKIKKYHIKKVAKSENLIMDAINCDGLASAVTTEGKGRRASENGERFSVLFSVFLFFSSQKFR
jgi:hypothetical protein